MKDKTKKTLFGWLIAIACFVVLFSSGTTAISNVKDLLKGDETQVEQEDVGSDTEASNYAYEVR